jgi:hypothetical protein
MYSSEGTWKLANPLQYIWNYYDYSDNPSNHPFSRSELISYANGTQFTVARDANKHLLFDFNRDGEIDTVAGGFSFHEHNGRGLRGESRAAPFTHFWFDDNWLARYVSQSYGLPEPSGLSEYTDFNRWKILAGDFQYWTPYNGPEPDRLALDGLYFLSLGDIARAMGKWQAIVNSSGTYFNPQERRYIYPGISENYHLALFQILSAHLLNRLPAGSAESAVLLQHWVSIRSHILSQQQKLADDQLAGWVSSITDGNSLMNTESISAGVLALGAGAGATFEIGKLPMQNHSAGYFYRPTSVFSAAIEGGSRPGYMAFGPYQSFPAKAYKADFVMRARTQSPGRIATVDIYDARNGQVLATKDLYSSDFVGDDTWSSISLGFRLQSSSNSLEFRIYWHGVANLDAAVVRLSPTN